MDKLKNISILMLSFFTHIFYDNYLISSSINIGSSKVKDNDYIIWHDFFQS